MPKSSTLLRPTIKVDLLRVIGTACRSPASFSWLAHNEPDATPFHRTLRIKPRKVR